MRRSPCRPRPTAVTRIACCALLLAGAFALSACGGDEVTEPDNPAVDDGPVAPEEHDPDLPEMPVNEDPERVRCTGEPQGVFDATAIIGEELEQAEEAALEQGCSVREVERDGEALAVTQDFRPDRVNVATEGDRVSQIVDLG